MGTDENFSYSTSLNAYYESYGADYFFQNVRSIFQKDDLSIVNMEGTLTDETAREAKTFAFKAPAKYAAILSGSSMKRPISLITTVMTMGRRATPIQSPHWTMPELLPLVITG